ncbi:MAG: hypothetical protein WBF93_17825 [Pirellulales bacterium]
MSTSKTRYEQLRPLIVWIGLTELGWIVYWLLSGGDNPALFVGTVVAWIVAMLAWLALVIYAGLGVFFLKHSDKLSNLIGVGIVVTVAVAIFGLLPAAREGVLNTARNTSDLQLIYIHVLRLLAIGTIIKYLHDELPLHFVILGSIPDFVLAIRAVVLAVVASNAPLNHSFLVGWHLIGFSVFLGAGISMFFSVPSPRRIYDKKPDASIVFQFPN